MGLQSSLNTALTGLQAAETTISVIGNNVANSNTVGFKASEVVFATQFLQTQSIGSAPSDTNGGTNPRQIGLGVRVAEISPNFNQGTIEISSNGLDLAIQGDGFLVVQGSQGEQLYTRNGQLSLNSENRVVNSTGNALLGFGLQEGTFNLDQTRLQPIEIPLGGARVAQATTEATFQGVLNPTVQAGTVAAQIQSQVFGDASVVFPTGTDTDPFDSNDVRIQVAPLAGTASATTAPAVSGEPFDASAGEVTYQYRVAFLDGAGQSTASNSFQVTIPTGEAATQIDLTGLPATPADFDSIAIFRTEANGSEFRLVSVEPAGTTNFTDTTTDATLAAANVLDDSALENAAYTYFATFVNSTNGDESRPSAALGPVAVADNTSSVRLDFSDLQPPSDGFDRIRIYRNAGDDTSTFFEVADIPAGTTSFVDRASNTSIQGNRELNFDGVGVQGGSLLRNVQLREGFGTGATYTQPFAGLGTLEFFGEINGTATTTQSLEITDTTTVQELLDFVGDTLGLQQQSNVNDIPLPIGGGQVNITNGVLSVTSNFGQENAVSIPLTGFRLTNPGSVVSNPVAINFSETQQANGPGTTSEFLVFDSLGSPLTVRLTTVLESATPSSTTYRWVATSGDSQPFAPDQSTAIGNGVLVFDSSGNLVSSPSASISINRNQTASESPLEIDLDFSTVTSLADTNSSGDPISSLNVISQDGFPPGVLTDFIITESGLIQGQFSNGVQRTLGQLQTARFANSQGLQQLGNSLFAQSVNSGNAITGTPGEDGLGAITAGAVELSNTDIGQDLIDIILAQTQYQAGSRVIATTQELLDELLALQR